MSPAKPPIKRLLDTSRANLTLKMKKRKNNSRLTKKPKSEPLSSTLKTFISRSMDLSLDSH
jgi:hypothetical protein